MYESEKGARLAWRWRPLAGNGFCGLLCDFDGVRGVVQEACYGATGKACLRRICTAGEDDGNARTEDDSGKLRAAEVFKLLGEHVAAFEIGHDENVGLTCNRRVEMLDLRGVRPGRLAEDDPREA